MTVGYVVTLTGPRRIVVEEEAVPPLMPGSVRVETVLSGISAGTELTFYRGSNPYLQRRFDRERRLFCDGGRAEHPYPLSGFGYQQVGRVVEVGEGVAGPQSGALVWGAWGHRAGAVVPAPVAAERVLEAGLPTIAGIFARIGAVALNAVLDAELNLGETAAVFGLGVPGLLAVQLASLGGGSVVAVDRLPRRLELARSLGAVNVVDATRDSPADAIKTLTGGRGADVSIELSGSYDALAEAVRATAAGSRVVAAGFYQGAGAPLRLGEEFHHNRIEVVGSQIGSVAPRLAHRWDVTRLEQTVMRLAAEGRLQLEPLVSHLVPATEAASAFRLLDERPQDAVQVVLDFQRG